MAGKALSLHNRHIAGIAETFVFYIISHKCSHVKCFLKKFRNSKISVNSLDRGFLYGIIKIVEQL